MDFEFSEIAEKDQKIYLDKAMIIRIIYAHYNSESILNDTKIGSYEASFYDLYEPYEKEISYGFYIISDRINSNRGYISYGTY